MDRAGAAPGVGPTRTHTPAVAEHGADRGLRRVDRSTRPLARPYGARRPRQAQCRPAPGWVHSPAPGSGLRRVRLRSGRPAPAIGGRGRLAEQSRPRRSAGGSRGAGCYGADRQVAVPLPPQSEGRVGDCGRNRGHSRFAYAARELVAFNEIDMNRPRRFRHS